MKHPKATLTSLVREAALTVAIAGAITSSATILATQAIARHDRSIDDGIISSYSENIRYVYELEGVSKREISLLRRAAMENYSMMLADGTLEISPRFSLIGSYKLRFKEEGPRGEYPGEMATNIFRMAGLKNESIHLICF